MATYQEVRLPAVDRGTRPPRRLLRLPLGRLVSSPTGAIGVGIVLLLLVFAVAAPLLAPFDPIEQPGKRLLDPDSTYLLGTDQFGRDILSRIIYGARVALMVGVISVSIALAIGGTLGLISGFYLGVVDTVVQRVVDTMLAFPSLILIIAISSVLGPSMSTAMLAIGLVQSSGFARIVRGPVLVVMQEQYVEAARAIGAHPFTIMYRYLLPNIAAPLIVQTTLAFSGAILAEAGLSFLGLGTQPPDPSWGTMLGDGRKFMELAPAVAVFPGLAISLAVLGFNLLGDALRDVLDPTLRRR
ncbi:MAG: peptide/nickel transport system permease protein [Thermomicrobiales bacterium]|jgi:peptide/nickel transport system permease protein|nr:peptide/nickel transport system permease protein [Thermomicrobiales bacterium]MEA2523311.1 peptide/nickel transport system permease protein [Thermomicrobiales bacterium]MEA2598808.1 peptide/nickel transport system permease protein [Thermomicrobiales bacterium]